MITRSVWGLVLFFSMMGSVHAATFQSYFLAPKVQSDNIKLFPKWTLALKRTQADFQKLQSMCKDPGPYTPCRLKTWQSFLLDLKEKPLRQQAQAINVFINKYPYIEDIINWGVSDYWETPHEFQQHNGDCEDFSMAKFVSLRALGVSEDLLRVAIVRDLNLGGIIHAVVLVTLDGETYVMDNQIKELIRAKKIFHYVPLYAINESHWWQYLVTP